MGACSHFCLLTPPLLRAEHSGKKKASAGKGREHAAVSHELQKKKYGCAAAADICSSPAYVSIRQHTAAYGSISFRAIILRRDIIPSNNFSFDFFFFEGGAAADSWRHVRRHIFSSKGHA